MRVLRDNILVAKLATYALLMSKGIYVRDLESLGPVGASSLPLGTLRPRALGILNHVDPSVPVSKLYVVHDHY